MLQELLSTPEPESGVFGARARSASDAAVLRRKGHLKEQDALIDFLLQMHSTHTSLEVMLKMDRWIVEHRQACLVASCSLVGAGDVPNTPLSLMSMLIGRCIIKRCQITRVW